MVILPFQHVHVQSHACRLRPAAQSMMDHLRIQRPHHGPLEAKIADKERARRDVDDGARESFIQRGVGVTEAGNSGARPECLGEGGAKGEEGIFGSMVVVDCGE